jgi:peptidoglycan hydrolase-like protein with peptidoglycan-binding domain
MRRVSVLAFVSAIALILLTSGDAERTGSANVSGVAAGAKDDASGTLKAVSVDSAYRIGVLRAGEREAHLKTQYKAVETAETADIRVAPAGEKDQKAESGTKVIEVDAEQYAAAHVPSSANADETDPALAKLSFIDLKSAAQRELARLGCYDTKIDGLWGPESEAAVQSFNQRVAGGFADEPTAELVQALRAAPDGLCGCPPESESGACVIALKKDHPKDAKKKEKLSYLPPWMQGEERVATESEDHDPTPQVITVGPSSSRQYVRRRVRSRQEPRYAERYRRKRSRDWLPKGWPRAGR